MNEELIPKFPYRFHVVTKSWFDEWNRTRYTAKILEFQDFWGCGETEEIAINNAEKKLIKHLQECKTQRQWSLSEGWEIKEFFISGYRAIGVY